MKRRILLFVSSYIPLYILLLLKDILERITDGGRFVNPLPKGQLPIPFNESNDFAFLALVILTCVSFILLRSLIKGEPKGNYRYEVTEIKNQTAEMYFNYISLYLLSCFELSLNSIVDISILCFLMVMIGYIYISNRMTYLNPVLTLLGYRVYECHAYCKDTSEKFDAIVIAPKTVTLKENTEYLGTSSEDFLYISKKNPQPLQPPQQPQPQQ